MQAASECEDAFAPGWPEGLQPALLAGVHPVFPFELCLLGFGVGGPRASGRIAFWEEASQGSQPAPVSALLSPCL